MASSLVTSSLAARGRQEPGACLSLPTCQEPDPQPSKATGAAPWAQRGRLLLQSFCLTPARVRPQNVPLLLATLNICVFTHCLCSLYPHRYLHLLIRTFPFKTNTRSLPAPLRRTRLRSAQKGNVMVFPSCVKEHFQPHFSFGHSSRIFPKQIPYLADSLWDSMIQAGQVTGSVLLLTPRCLPWCAVLQQQGDRSPGTTYTSGNPSPALGGGPEQLPGL